MPDQKKLRDEVADKHGDVATEITRLYNIGATLILVCIDRGKQEIIETAAKYKDKVMDDETVEKLSQITMVMQHVNSCEVDKLRIAGRITHKGLKFALDSAYQDWRHHGLRWNKGKQDLPADELRQISLNALKPADILKFPEAIDLAMSETGIKYVTETGDMTYFSGVEALRGPNNLHFRTINQESWGGLEGDYANYQFMPDLHRAFERKVQEIQRSKSS